MMLKIVFLAKALTQRLRLLRYKKIALPFYIEYVLFTTVLFSNQQTGCNHMGVAVLVIYIELSTGDHKKSK